MNIKYYFLTVVVINLVSPLVKSEYLNPVNRRLPNDHGGPGGIDHGDHGVHGNKLPPPPPPANTRQDDDNSSYDYSNDKRPYDSPSGYGPYDESFPKKRYEDDLYSTYDDDDYRTSTSSTTERHYNVKKSVEIVIRPWSTACPKRFDPSKVRNDKYLIVAIFGSNEFDVSSIDLSSIRLSGSSGQDAVKPVDKSANFNDVSSPSGEQCSCGRGSPDGHDDLLLYFDANSVANIPEIARAKAFSQVKLTIKGTYHQYSAKYFIYGKDCLEVVR